MRRYPSCLHHHFDRAVDSILGVADCRRQVVERKSVGVDFGGIKTLLRHKGFGSVGCAPALAPDAVKINVVAHDMSDVDWRLLVRKCRETDFAAAIDHTDGVVNGIWRA